MVKLDPAGLLRVHGSCSGCTVVNLTLVCRFTQYVSINLHTINLRMCACCSVAYSYEHGDVDVDMGFLVTTTIVVQWKVLKQQMDWKLKLTNRKWINIFDNSWKMPIISPSGLSSVMICCFLILYIIETEYLLVLDCPSEQNRNHC